MWSERNPLDLKRGIDKAVVAAVEELKKTSRPTTTSKEIAQVGAISAKRDASIGDRIAEAMDKATTIPTLCALCNRDYSLCGGFALTIARASRSGLVPR